METEILFQLLRGLTPVLYNHWVRANYMVVTPTPPEHMALHPAWLKSLSEEELASVAVQVAVIFSKKRGALV